MTNEYPFMQFNQMALRVYTEEEIRKLSVLEIDQVKTFDEAGFPIKKGLYDAAMGISWAIDGVDECETCGMGSQSCPGHFGHIQLTVPAFNPLLFSFTYNLMKGTCVHCHQFTADRREKRAKFGLCDDGAMVVLDEAEDDEGEDVIAQLSKFRSASDGHVKGAVADFHRLFNDRFKSVLFKRKSRCPHCKQNNGSLRNDHGRALILDFSNLSKTALSKQEAKRRVQQSIMQKAEGGAGEELMRPDELLDEAIDDEQNGENFHHDDEDDEGGEHVDDEGREERRGRRKKSTGAGAAGTILDPLALSERNLAAQLRHVVDGTCDKLVWRAAEVREHFRILWRKEAQLLQLLFPSLFHEVEDGYPIDVLFVKLLLVEPILYRPIRLLRGERYEHPRSSQFRKVMEADQLLTVIRITMTSDRPVNLAAKDLVERKIAGKSLHEKLHNAYIDLQVQVNLIYDMESAGGPRDQSAKKPGLKQILERKEGLFRMNMMGKRVNYACRSVITPDPYLDVDEVGIPEHYARKLTFPEPANYFNILKLRDAVKAGPSSYPGANQVELSQGVPPTRLLNRYRRDVDARVASSMRLVAGRSTVQRHLENGDMMLMNRQPTLHKPSIMGHRARVLRSGAKALRMNYAPCKAYNADFDGDEMNGHFVQNRVAQTEAREIVNVGNNFLVPKDGTPILGLIQDHVVAGVLMTLRNTFLSRADFMKLVFAAFAITTKRLEIPQPAMLRPQRLYTGKQVISTILRNIIPEERPRINFVTKSKTPPSCWGVPDEGLDYEMSESQVIFRDGELLCGVIDKQHCGSTQFGLVHCCYELYGSKIATKILSCFSRVFTTYLQMRGFTLGVADILMSEKADATRHKVVEKLKQSGPKIVKKALNLPDDCPVGEMKKAMGAAHYNPQRDTTGVQLLDHSAKVTLDKMSRQINDCLKGGLIRAFPDNNLQMMIQSGSKGSIVNAIQISCALGQIELEGQRPPLTAFGRSLPSFARYDPSPRAGGYVHQRFLTGIGPQELFFHTMAGREGLIDTAVKTSRSGYLQRCVIKHMEGLSVRYDNTVRDHDNSVIQFHYGEDGLDVGRAIFLHERQFPFLDENPVAVKMSAIPRSMEQQLDMNTGPPEHQFKRIMKWKRKHSQAHHESRQRQSAFLNFSAQHLAGTPRHQIQSAWQEMSEEERQPYVVKNLVAPRPVNVKFNQARMLGVLPEAVLAQLAKFQPLNVDKKEFDRIIYCKGMRAMVEPGENVGLLAAQSIGEPSTQMTLNTFHFAGRGEMNVTLGIPRLREILMTFNRNIKTPMAEVRIHADVSDQQIERVKGELNPVTLKQVLESSVVQEFLDLDGSGHSYRRYTLRLKIATRKKRDEEASHISSRRILDELERRFFKEVAVALGKRYQEVLAQESIVHRRLRAGNIEAGVGGFAQGEGHQGADDDATSESGEGAAGELDASEVRQTHRHQDDAEYEGEAEDRVQVGDEEQEVEEAEVETIDDEEELLSSDEATQSSFAGDGRRTTQVGAAQKEARIEKVKQLHVLITSYNFDERTDRWCETAFSMAVRNKSKFDAKSLINREIERFVVSRVAGIDRVIVREEQRSGDEKVRILQTQGINLEALYKRAELLDLDTLYSNDINLMMDKYGVEAAAKTIVKEMNNVFGAYGIHVDARHLNLTADYMTFTGTIQPFNRHSMALSASTLQKLTFETSMNFAKEAIINGEEDELRSPSARLVTGQLLNNGGTGGFELIQRVDYILGKGKR